MIKGDYREIVRTLPDGKKKIIKLISSLSGTEYVLSGRLGQGGVARVFKVRRRSDGQLFAFKLFDHSDSAEIQWEHRNIRSNIESLIAKAASSDTELFDVLARPYELVELKASNGFGYIMEMVNLDHMMKFSKMMRQAQPDRRISLAICRNMAAFYAKLHRGYGLCYKDLNRGNLFVNPDTGEIRIIDLDNISVPETKTVIGTYGFIAPEVYETGRPDYYSDYFSESSLYFFILTMGAFPLIGKKVLEYSRTGANLNDYEVQKKVFGKEAQFVFDPENDENSIRDLPEYKDQVKLWDDLPDALKQAFIRTFTAGLHDPYQRVSDKNWEKIFDELAGKELVQCRCGKHNFGVYAGRKNCIYCRRPIRKLTAPKVIVQKKKEVSPCVKFDVIRSVEPLHSQLTADTKNPKLKDIHPMLHGDLLTVKVNRKRHLFGALNTSPIRWTVYDKDHNKSHVEPGETIILEKGTIIVVMYRKLQLAVSEVITGGIV